ncbi:MAG: tol-pal system protein YbgF [Betaproteobacteria bacterium RIFCSPHIGHO2_12_FULL_69_13]|nr:MAG: tol-pal system protein YbgF [Betaproteobacteria bacterium RIFCSPHIGHO2_12_FULL_69_13]OGA66288.1 MAG: tol-pal system protein YbgF [Betaproteobacteria bacterium RIFCSPLOWO2_12_FULL_68_20]
MRRLAVVAALGWALAAPALAQGLFDDNEARRRVDNLRQQVEASQKAIDERLSRIEAGAAERRMILDLAGQIEGLREELARMRGQIEVLTYQAENAEKRQKDLYLDIDTRLRKLEQGREQAAAPDKPPAGDAAAVPAETKAYEAALNQFKLGQYALAVSAFQGFLVTYPESQLAPSAQYWIGNAHYAQREYKAAIAAQQKLLSAWPENPKAPDAMLNIASAQEAMGDKRSAQRTLQGLVAKFPSSPAAASAKQRLVSGGKR